MPSRDDKEARLLAIANGQSTPPPPGANPIAQLRWLAEHAESESVKLQANRTLLEKQLEAKRQREAAKQASGPASHLDELSDEQLFELADEDTAANVRAVLNGGRIGDTLPETRRVIEAHVESELARRG